MDLTGKEILGYKLIRKIGEGGMGAVYFGVHTDLGQEVAVKVLDPLLARDEELRHRFIQEARIQISLKNPNIVMVHTADTKGEYLSLIMEYVDGLALDEVLRKRKKLPLDEALALFEQVLKAVGHAHQIGVVHRDLKPANIMVQGDGTAKVMDFGIARVLGDMRLTRTGTVMGSAYYMAPEQVLGEKGIGRRADIYSLGITLYETLTGRTPFEEGNGESSDSDYRIKDAHVRRKPPDPRKYEPSLPEHVAQSLLKAMEKDPAKRHESCEAFWQSTSMATQAENSEETLSKSLPESLSKPKAEHLPKPESRRVKKTAVVDNSGSSVSKGGANQPKGKKKAGTYAVLFFILAIIGVILLNLDQHTKGVGRKTHNSKVLVENSKMLANNRKVPADTDIFRMRRYRVEGFHFGMPVSTAKEVLLFRGFDHVTVKKRKVKKMGGYILFRIYARKKKAKKGLFKVKAYFPKGKLLRYKLYYKDKVSARYDQWARRFGAPTKIKGNYAAWLLKGDVLIEARRSGNKLAMADFGQALSMSVISQKRADRIKKRIYKKRFSK